MGFIDKHYHNERRVTERVTKKVNITEHRAPTDESLKLLKELDQTSKNNILFSITNKDNILNGTILAFVTGFNSLPHISNDSSNVYKSVGNMNTELHYRFNLNGKEYKGKDIIEYDNPELRQACKSKHDAELFYGNFMAKKLASVISIQLITEFFNNQTKQNGTI